jgi:hypothetical protein
MLCDHSGLGDATPEYWIDRRNTGRSEGATAEKAVPFPCAVLDPKAARPLNCAFASPDQGLVAPYILLCYHRAPLTLMRQVLTFFVGKHKPTVGDIYKRIPNLFFGCLPANRTAGTCAMCAPQRDATRHQEVRAGASLVF